MRIHCLLRVFVSILLGCGFAAGLRADGPIIRAQPNSQTIFVGDSVTFAVGADGTPPLVYQWLRNGLPLAAGTTNQLTFPAAAVDDNTGFRVIVTNPLGSVTSAVAVLTVDFGTPGPPQTNHWLEVTHFWKFNAGSTNLGNAWFTPGFSDAAWGGGGGALFLEESDLPAPKTTALPIAGGKIPSTCYFRTRFTNDLANPYAISLLASVLIDDGAVFHLNGKQVFQLGMPEGQPGYEALANRTVGNASWEGPFEFAITNLAAGLNVLAVEVHQINSTSTDIVMGMTLDAVWQPRLRDLQAPFLAETFPPDGERVASLSNIRVQFSESVRGVDGSDLLVNGTPATNVVAEAPGIYLFQFPPAAPGAVLVSWAPQHGIMDRSANANVFVPRDLGYLVGPVSQATQLAFARVAQSSDASPTNTAKQAADGTTATFSLTGNLPGSYWLAELPRPFLVERIEVVSRSAPYDSELAGCALRLYNLDDQIVFESRVTNATGGKPLVIELPERLPARSVWIGLAGNQTNGAGSYRVGMAEVRLFGEAALPYGLPPVVPPVPGTNSARVWQSSEYGGFPASNALDGDLGSFTHTDNLANSYWMADLGKAFPIGRIEVVNRDSCCDNRLAGLVLRIFDGLSNSVASSVLPNPGLGGVWRYSPPAGTQGRWVRIGLEDGQKNAAGNYYVTLAEVRAFSGTTNLLDASPGPAVTVTNNLASFKPSYMLRLDESVPPASRANDDDFTTETKTTVRTVDGYWEVDLGGSYALYGVRAIAASGIGTKLTNATVRLFDEGHESVFATRVTGGPEVFDTDLYGPVFARFVRVGLEDKQRTDPAGGIEFYIGFREVEVFGRPTNQVGILTFNASTNRISPGQPVVLSWAVDDVRRAEIHPAYGSVGGYTEPSGIGSLVVTPTNSTEYLLVVSNAAGVFTRGVGVEVGTNRLPVQISELVADNIYSLKDGYGDAPDWIELRNTGNFPVNLAGYGLSDDLAQPMKWVFPSTLLKPHDTLIVFASGRTTATDPAGHLHSSFRLEKNGGALVLTAADGVTTVDQISAYPELDNDLAFGRNLEGKWGFCEPTPGLANTGMVWLGWLKPLAWSHGQGFYESAFSLSLTNPNPIGTILYSLDGSLPNTAYRTSLPIARTTALRAQVVQPGYKPARVQTTTFIFVNDVITSSVMNPAITQDPAYAPRMRSALMSLPTLSLCLPGQPEYEEQAGSMEVLWPKGGSPVQVNCGISRFGNAWTKFAKRSFRLKFRARYGEAKLQAPLFDGFDRGVLAKSSFDELDLRSGSQDMEERGFYMAGRFVEDTMLDMGSLNPHGRFVHVYLNGVYWGQYDCRELLVDHFLADYLGGAAEDYVVVRGNDNVTDDFVLGAPEPPNVAPWEATLALKNSYTAVRSRLDISHLIDFMLLWNYGECESEYRCCGPIVPGTGFKFWIADADGFLRTGALGLNRTSRTGPGGLFGGLVTENHPDFKALLADRIYQHFFNHGALTPTANDARLAARMREIRDSLLAECARWGYRTPSSWESAAATIRSSLFPNRTSQLLTYLRTAGLYPAFDPPVLSQYGGLVTNGYRPTLSAPAGTIYFTLDGTDPRLAGGGISPNARVWTAGSVTVTNDLTLNARVRSSTGAWSALAQPVFLLANRRPPGTRDLLITEIHYNPPGADDEEFIELYNHSSSLLDLSGVSLSNGVRFVFPIGTAMAPGSFLVVTESSNTFALRYQRAESPYYHPGIRVAGDWVGALDNAGETISLIASNGVELTSIPYRSGGDWPERPDGRGSSLELRILPPTAATDAEIKAMAANGRQWTASSLFHGSPGRFDSFVRSIRFNEVLTHTDLGLDWLELVNMGTEPVDLAGSTLTDNLGLPTQWTFPTASLLLPGQFSLISAAQLPFALSELGDQLFLLQVSGTNILRFLDSIDFPAAEREESFGLYQRSDGFYDLTETRANTPGAANALPRVGPVVISEVMFNPGPNQAQYIELANVTASPVALYDPAHPTNVWRLEGVGTFSFSMGTTLAPCSQMIICGTNPAALRAQYAVPVSVPVLGPWSGELDRDGETLRLLRPGAPEPDSSVPYYRVDHVSYRTNSPWPETGSGKALERIPLQAYGSEPSAWRPTPGNGTPGVAASNRPPVIQFAGQPVAYAGQPIRLVLTVADPDAPWQQTSLSAVQLPVGGAFDPMSGTFLWSPAASEPPGEHPMVIQATDSVDCVSQPVLLELSVRVLQPLAVNWKTVMGLLQVNCPAIPGESYVLEHCTDLLVGNWEVIRESGAATGDNVTFADIELRPAGAHFLRVRWNR